MSTQKAPASSGQLTRANNQTFNAMTDSIAILPQATLVTQESRFITAQEIAKDLQRSERFAYNLIRQLNKELEAKGKYTARGRVLRTYYLQRTGIGD